MSNSTRKFRCNCLICCLFLLFISVLCFVFAFSIFMIIFQPQEFKFTITDAAITEFNITKIENSSTNNTILSYNFVINVTVRNPNKKVGVYFDRFEAIAYYGQKRLSRVYSVAPYYHGHKNTTTFRAIFEDKHQSVTFENQSAINQYNFDTESGVYSIDVKINVRTRERYGNIRTGHLKPPTIDCKLKVPLLISNKIRNYYYEFKATKCENVYILTGPSNI